MCDRKKRSPELLDEVELPDAVPCFSEGLLGNTRLIGDGLTVCLLSSDL